MIKVEIEVYTNEVTPEEDRDICFFADGDWYKGRYENFPGEPYFFSVLVGAGYFVNAKDVDLWFYLPERDIFE